MKALSARLIVLIAITAMATLAFPDILVLKDGREVAGQYEGGTSRVIQFRTAGDVFEYDLLSVASIRISAASPEGDVSRTRDPQLARSFDSDQERVIREWFSNRANLSGLPPGLSRRESLPPGLAKQVRRNGTLPPGLERRLEPLPLDLERRLPGLWEGLKRVVLGRDVLLLDAASRIVDLIENVL